LINKVKAHVLALDKAFKAANTPEAIAKRAKDKAKRDAAKALKDKAKRAEEIAEFMRGERRTVQGLAFDLMRMTSDGTVVTTRGAEVPQNQAWALYRAILDGTAKPGMGVGHFSLSKIEKLDSDTLVIVGCHKFLLSDAAQVFGEVQL